MDPRTLLLKNGLQTLFSGSYRCLYSDSESIIIISRPDLAADLAVIGNAIKSLNFVSMWLKWCYVFLNSKFFPKNL